MLNYSFYHLVKHALEEVDALIQTQLRSQVSLTEEVGKHITQSGGKRLRPLMVLLSAGMFQALDEQAITLAAIVELIHTVTLLHDDVVDNSALRRGQKTANALWGNQASILVGDFLYSRTFQMMVNLRNFDVLEALAKTTTVITEGEVLQLQNCHNPEMTEESYRQVITSKTGALFSAAAQTGPILTHRPAEEINQMARFGLHLGTAFQLIDDTLDYCADPEKTGKNLGDDLAEGKLTLPLLYALKMASTTEKTFIRQAITQGSLEKLEAILEVIQATGAIEYTQTVAKQEAAAALAALNAFPDSAHRQALADLVEFAVRRRF